MNDELPQVPAEGSGSVPASLSNLSGVLNALQSDSAERQAKLEGLTDAVAEGEYYVDPYAVGGSILNESLR